ncbi:MAG TPA: IPT/TIG domain-containing protein, partial [Polyangiaceae bacterium]|nr:IPT/TIG domain-containing protein [Polyangiaceae bacterium]
MIAAACFAVAACSDSHPYKVSDLRDAGMPMQDAGGFPGSSAFPGNTGINATTLTVTGIEPASGPFAGGNQATVRGSAFTQDALVFIGDRLVQPADTILVDRNSLLVVVPAGEVGRADVRVEVPGEDGKTKTATREDAYTYNPLLLEPTHGSIAGGTSVLVTLQGARFDKSVEVDFAGEKCTGLQVITPSQVRCKTPPGEVGTADVVVRWPDHPDRAALTAAGAFE